MEIEINKKDGITFIKPLDSIEAMNSNEFKRKMIDVINQDNHSIVLNFANVPFIDSCGLGNLISILKLLSMKNGNIVICQARNEIIKLFNLTNLDQVFSLCKDEKEAVEFLKNHPATSVEDNT